MIDDPNDTPFEDDVPDSEFVDESNESTTPDFSAEDPLSMAVDDDDDGSEPDVMDSPESFSESSTESMSEPGLDAPIDTPPEGHENHSVDDVWPEFSSQDTGTTDDEPSAPKSADYGLDAQLPGDDGDAVDEDVAALFAAEAGMDDAGLGAIDADDEDPEGVDEDDEDATDDELDGAEGSSSAWYLDKKNLVAGAIGLGIFAFVVLPQIVGSSPEPKARTSAGHYLPSSTNTKVKTKTGQVARHDSPQQTAPRKHSDSSDAAGAPKTPSSPVSSTAPRQDAQPTSASQSDTSFRPTPQNTRKDPTATSPQDAMRETQKAQSAASRHPTRADRTQAMAKNLSSGMAGFGDQFYDSVGDKPYLTYRRSRVFHEMIPQHVDSPGATRSVTTTVSKTPARGGRGVGKSRSVPSGVATHLQDNANKLDALASALVQNKKQLDRLSRFIETDKSASRDTGHSSTPPAEQWGEAHQVITKQSSPTRQVHLANVNASGADGIRQRPRLARQHIDGQPKSRNTYVVVGVIDGKAWLRNPRTDSVTALLPGNHLAGYGTVTNIHADGTIETSSGISLQSATGALQ